MNELYDTDTGSHVPATPENIKREITLTSKSAQRDAIRGEDVRHAGAHREINHLLDQLDELES